MIGKIIGAVAGSKLAESTPKLSGPAGALVGAVSATALRRLSIPALVALTAGGYAWKKYSEKKAATGTSAAPKKPRPSKTAVA